MEKKNLCCVYHSLSFHCVASQERIKKEWEEEQRKEREKEERKQQEIKEKEVISLLVQLGLLLRSCIPTFLQKSLFHCFTLCEVVC